MSRAAQRRQCNAANRTLTRKQSGINAAAWFYWQPGFHAPAVPVASNAAVEAVILRCETCGLGAFTLVAGECFDCRDKARKA